MNDFLGSNLPPTANRGLVYDRYADIWSGPPRWAPQTSGGKAVRQQFLEDVAKKQAREVEERTLPLLQSLHARRTSLWKAVGARVVEVALKAPLVSGLGMTHALDVGFVWDRNLGVPYLPATSLKGAARAWAEQWDALDGEMTRRLFGFNDPASEHTSAGSVIFHAFYPLKPPQLRVDVLNTHFADYYREGKAPGDWLDPIPVFFLTVPAGQVFRTAIHPGADAGPDDLDQAVRCLRDALAMLGVGAKPAVGYGLFGRAHPTAAGY